MSAKRAQLSKDAMKRWDAMFEAQRVRMERQRESIGRMAHMLTEAVAGLAEIAECDDLGPDQRNETVVYLKGRAKEALAVVEEMRLRDEAAADASDGEG